MFKHLLVPLDGSRLAETVMPSVRHLAEELHAEVTLIHILERNAPKEIHGERHLTNEKDAELYLSDAAKEFLPPGIEIHTHVHTAEVQNLAKSIVDHSGELKPDLIALCTHGEGGIKSLVVGSIAQQVITLGKVPVLLVQPPETGKKMTPSFTHFLIALDGEDEHEVGMNVAGELAQVLGAELHLLTVIETLTTLSGHEAATGLLLPRATSFMLEMAEEDAFKHLQSHAIGWEKDGLEVDIDVRRGNPAQVIAEAASGTGCDLIVLGTHGKSGIQAFWSESVASKVPGLTQIPLLLVPVRPLTK